VKSEKYIGPSFKQFCAYYLTKLKAYQVST